MLPGAFRVEILQLNIIAKGFLTFQRFSGERFVNPLTKLRLTCPAAGDKRGAASRKGRLFFEKTQKNRPRAGTIFPGGSPKGQRGDFSPVFAVKVQKASVFPPKQQKKAPRKRGACSPPVSRVLWSAAIYLGRTLLPVSVPPVWRLAEQAVAPRSVLLRIEFTGCPGHPGHRWALTPPFHLFPGNRGSLFLLHLSGGRPRPMLSVILLCEARTFLTGSPPRGCPADCPFIIREGGKKVNGRNVRRMERKREIFKKILKNVFIKTPCCFLNFYVMILSTRKTQRPRKIQNMIGGFPT